MRRRGPRQPRTSRGRVRDVPRSGGDGLRHGPVLDDHDPGFGALGGREVGVGRRHSPSESRAAAPHRGALARRRRGPDAEQVGPRRARTPGTGPARHTRRRSTWPCIVSRWPPPNHHWVGWSRHTDRSPPARGRSAVRRSEASVAGASTVMRWVASDRTRANALTRSGGSTLRRRARRRRCGPTTPTRPPTPGRRVASAACGWTGNVHSSRDRPPGIGRADRRRLRRAGRRRRRHRPRRGAGRRGRRARSSAAAAPRTFVAADLHDEARVHRARRHRGRAPRRPDRARQQRRRRRRPRRDRSRR